MSIFLILSFLFAVGSTLGWCIEVLFRHHVSKKWVNPGFLIGPYLPIYGFSLCILYLLTMLEPHLPMGHIAMRKAVLFLIMAAVITVIEFAAGRIFIKGMKIELWDYSNEWGNVQGIICPKFSFFWLLLSAVYYFFVHPYILDMLQWLASNLAFSFCIGFFFGVFALDMAYAFRIMYHIRKFAAEYQIVVRLEELKAEIEQSKKRLGERHRFLFILRSAQPLKEHLEEYLHTSSVQERLQKFHDKVKKKH